MIKTRQSGRSGTPVGVEIIYPITRQSVKRVTRSPLALRSDLGETRAPTGLPNDAENSTLVSAHLAGDPRAFDHLYRRYSFRLLNFINRIIGDRERSEDLVQEAFVRVHRHLNRFDLTRQFSTWIYTIASNLAKNELRNRSRTPLVFHESVRAGNDEDSPALQFEDKGNRPDELYRRRYLAEAVNLTISNLSDRHREVFTLRELEGKSYDEIATITGCNLGTVKSRLNRARQSFAAEIEPFLD